MKGDSYTKAEGMDVNQAKGNYAPAGITCQGESYTKSESDNKYQPKGSYQAAGYKLFEAESDTPFSRKGQLRPGGKTTAPVKAELHQS